MLHCTWMALVTVDVEVVAWEEEEPTYYLGLVHVEWGEVHQHPEHHHPPWTAVP
jgi:hypothetical protein